MQAAQQSKVFAVPERQFRTVRRVILTAAWYFHGKTDDIRLWDAPMGQLNSGV